MGISFLWSSSAEWFRNKARGFSKHFVIPPFLCPKLGMKKAEGCSHAEDMKKSARGLQSTVRPPVGQGRALIGDQEAKHWEAQCIWALRISYFSLKSVIFC